MTKEEFWDKIIITEEEKVKSEHFLRFRGIEAHEKVRIFLNSLTGKKVTYSSIATAFRYDKRIRRIIYKYIGFLEESIRAYIANNYSNRIKELNCLSKVSSLCVNKTLFESLNELTFNELKNQICSLSNEDKINLFPFYKNSLSNLKKDLKAAVALRNEISHNRFLLDNKCLLSCSVGDRNNSLWANVINLHNLLPEYLKKEYLLEIRNSCKSSNNKFDNQAKYNNQTKWELLPQIVILIENIDDSIN